MPRPILLDFLTIAAPYIPALGLRAALSGIQQTDYISSVGFIANGIALIAALRRSTPVAAAAAVSVPLIAAVDFAVRSAAVLPARIRCRGSVRLRLGTLRRHLHLSP